MVKLGNDMVLNYSASERSTPKLVISTTNGTWADKTSNAMMPCSIARREWLPERITNILITERHMKNAIFACAMDDKGFTCFLRSPCGRWASDHIETLTPLRPANVGQMWSYILMTAHQPTMIRPSGNWRKNWSRSGAIALVPMPVIRIRRGHQVLTSTVWVKGI